MAAEAAEAMGHCCRAKGIKAAARQIIVDLTLVEA